MSSVAELWQIIEDEGRTEPGWHVRRIRPDTACAMSAGIRQPDRMPGLLLELLVDDVPADLVFPRSSGFLVEPSMLTGRLPRVRYALSLTDLRYRPIFGVLCDDVAATAATAASPRNALRGWVSRLHAWQAFMARYGADGLSESAALGLLGELMVLRDELFSRTDAASALAMWTGPFREPDDFTLPGGFLEVKTTARQAPLHLDIPNADQLDDARGRILLAHVRLLPDNAGETLPAVIEMIRDHVLQEAPHRLDDLNTRLLSAGYVSLHADRYATAYRRDRLNLFEVRDGFPRLTRSGLHRGIRSCSYTIELSACAEFRVPENALDEFMTEGSHV